MKTKETSASKVKVDTSPRDAKLDALILDLREYKASQFSKQSVYRNAQNKTNRNIIISLFILSATVSFVNIFGWVNEARVQQQLDQYAEEVRYNNEIIGILRDQMSVRAGQTVNR